MEGVDGVGAENGNRAPEKDPANVNKENEVVDNSDVAEEAPKSEGLSSNLTGGGGGGGERAPDPPETKALNVPKKTTASKAQKDGARNGVSAAAKNQRAGLSQSLSFPARSILATNLRKSTALVKPAKPETSNGRSTGRQTISGSVARKSSHEKAGAGENGASSQLTKSNEGHMKPLRHSLPAKSEDDANSSTSSLTPRAAAQRKSTGSVFSFRLDERAEKRREFFMKLEEKTQAKEEEKTNLQAKSKESQEAEIKRLRKSLTFKASPMPSFYQEPTPKVELKKIPPTRARSPKLGRNKSSVTAGNNNSDGGSVSSPRAELVKSSGGAANTNGASTGLKKPSQKSLSKRPSQKLAAAKPDSKPLGSKTKVPNPKQKVDKAKVLDDKTMPSAEVSPLETCVVVETVTAHDTVVEASDPELPPSEVTGDSHGASEFPSVVIEVSARG